MKLFNKGLISLFIILSTFASLSFLKKETKFLKNTFKKNLVTPKLSKENDKKWANEILKGGYLLLFRHAEREKWIDVQMYDALESDLHKNGFNDSRYAEKDYFDKAVCLNSRGKIQAKAMQEVINYSKLPIGYVISSPSCRARQTANLVFGGYQKLDRDLVHYGPYDENQDIRNQKLKNLFLSLPIQDNTNTVISAHNSVADCGVFVNKFCDLGLEEGGFYVIEKNNDNLKLVYEFHNFNDFSKVFFKR